MTGATSQCPSETAFADWLDGHGTQETRAQFEAHLDRCAHCAQSVVELGALLEVATDQGAQPPAVPQRYRLVRRLGAGGMGIVYEAQDLQLERHVALKFLTPKSRDNPQQLRERLLREARALARLQHPNVIAVHDVGQLGEQVFVALELVQGHSAADWCASQARTWSEVVQVYLQAARGLAAAHAQGMVHRDVKPANVLVADSGRVWISDFGLVGDLPPLGESSEQSAGESPASTSITMTGELLGTPAYMAPEQLRGDRSDARSDQFSLAVAIWESLYGERPFAGDSVAELNHRFALGVPEPGLVDRAGQRVPEAVRQLLGRALRSQPQLRYPSLEPVIAQLERVIQPRGGASPRLSAGWRRPVMAAVAVGVAAACAVAVYAARSTSKETVSPSVAAEAHGPSAIVGPELTAVSAPGAGPGSRASGQRSPWKVHLDRALTAAVSRDHALCLAELDLAAQAGAGAKGTTTRAICEMQSGQCEVGRRRVHSYNVATGRGIVADREVLAMDHRYCDPAVGTLEFRLARIATQGRDAFANLDKQRGRQHCQRILDSAETALHDERTSETEPARLVEVYRSLTYCHIVMGDCPQAAAVWRKVVTLSGGEPDTDLSFGNQFAKHCAR